MVVEFLVVGGGGGGGLGVSNQAGGGGGGGGVVAGSFDLPMNTGFGVVVGIGGAVVNNGGASTFWQWTAPGGGAGGNGGPGYSGASGGGGSQGGSDGSGGAPTNGGAGSAAGGGSAGNGGGFTENAPAGRGGNGYAAAILGGYVVSAGGGGGNSGGGQYGNAGGSAGAGPGGVPAGGRGGGCHSSPGGNEELGFGATGGQNYGCGGGGGGASAGPPGKPPAAGGQVGCVYLRYPGAQVCTGGSVSSSGGYTTHAFGTPGSYTFTTPQPVPILNSVAPASGWRGQDTYVNLYGSNFVVSGSTIVPYTNGGMSLVSGTIYGNSTNVAVYVRLTRDALLGGNHLLAVSTSGGQSAWQYFYAAQLPPTITAVDNTTLPGGADIIFRPGGTYYTHVWGTELTNATTGAVSGTGVTCTLAAFGSDGIIALNIAVALNALPGNRTLTVTNEGGTSNAFTITIEALGATLTSVSPNYGFRGTTVSVVLGGTNFIGNCSVQVGDGSQVTIARLNVDAPTQMRAGFTIAPNATPGIYNVVVTTPAGQTNTLPFEVLASVVRPDAGVIIDQKPSWDTSTGMTAGYGVRFRVKSTPVPLNALGRYKLTGNVEPHVVTLRDQTSAIVSQAVVDFSAGGMGLSIAAIKKPFTAGPSRVFDAAYWLGCKFTTGASPVRVTGVGNYKKAGHIRPKRVAVVSTTGTILASGTVYGGPDNEFSYVPIAPITLAANTSYYLMGLQAQPDDCWDHTTVITMDPRFGVVDGSVYSLDGMVSFSGVVIPSCCYGPISLQCQVSAGTGGELGKWNYVPIPEVTLAANLEYTIDSIKYGPTGHDNFLYSDTAVMPDTGVQIAAPNLKQSMVMALTKGSPNAHEGYSLGMRFTTGVYCPRVVALGRWKRAGNVLKHLVSLRNSTTGAILVSAEVDFTGGKGMEEQFVYAEIPPFTLRANTAYDLVAKEYGNEGLYDYPNMVTMAGYVGSATCAMIYPDSAAHMTFGNPGNCYGPVSLLYDDDLGSASEAAISHFNDTAALYMRNDHAGALGFQFRAGLGISIFALGRWKYSGNVRSHVITLRDAAGTPQRSATVDFSKGDGRVGEWFYVPIQPFLMTYNAMYSLVSQETVGGDFWANDASAMTPRIYVCDQVQGCYNADVTPNNIVLDGRMGTCYGPPNFLFRVTEAPYVTPDARAYVTTNARFQKWDVGQQMAIII